MLSTIVFHQPFIVCIWAIDYISDAGAHTVHRSQVANGCILYVCFWLGCTKHSTSAIYGSDRNWLNSSITQNQILSIECAVVLSLFLFAEPIFVYMHYSCYHFFSTVSKVIFLWVWNFIVKNVACMSQAQIENHFLLKVDATTFNMCKQIHALWRYWVTYINVCIDILFVLNWLP